MRLQLPLRRFGKMLEAPLAPLLSEESLIEATSTVLKTVGWISAGLGAIAIGLVVGREIRLRYKFKRQTPYDRYAHAGASFQDDFGLGI